MGSPPPGPADSLTELRRHWNDFAAEDPTFYIATARTSIAEFYANGEGVAALMLELAGPGTQHGRLLEIGCGLGRLLVHFANEFDRVDGVDIAPEMIEQAERQGLPENVHVTTNSGDALDSFGAGLFDVVVCFQVFQHVPDQRIVAGYMAEVARVLRPGGRAVLHFDTRAYRLVERAIFRLPDFLLPRIRRRYIRRYRLGLDAPAEMARAAGLSVLGEQDPGSMLHFLVAEKAH